MNNELIGFLHAPILGVTLIAIFLISNNLLFPLGPLMITMAVLSMAVLNYWPQEKYLGSWDLEMEFIMTNKTYVYDGQEVQKTGRSATKKFRAGGRPLLQGSRKPDQIQIEIEALPDPNSAATPWKKWVREEELFQIDEEPDLLTEE